MSGITVDDIMELGPCPEYTLKRVEELFAGRTSITYSDILAMDIPYAHKVWVLDEIMSVQQRYLFVRRCGLAAAALWSAPEVVVRYLETGDEDLQFEAWDACREYVTRNDYQPTAAARFTARCCVYWENWSFLETTVENAYRNLGIDMLTIALGVLDETDNS